MKSSKLVFLFVVLIASLSSCSKTNNPVTQSNLIANYPLISDGVDSTGLNGPMILKNASFQNGGIYSNGIYDFSSDTNACIVRTPVIGSLKFESFSISMDFMVSEKRTQPVWVIGSNCRWLGFYLHEDGTIALLYNNWDFLASTKTYSINEWHNAKISYDGTTAKIYLDNDLAASLKFGNGYVTLNYTTCGSSDTEIGVTNYSNGDVFKGYVKNLKVYSPQ